MYVYLCMQKTNNMKTIIDIKKIKPVYLMTTKEELINERDFMEANWNNSMNERMMQLAKQSIILFKKPLSSL